MKIAGLLRERLGDLIMCTAAARQLKVQQPDCHLTFCVGKRVGHTLDLFRGLPYIDAFHVWDSDDNWPVQSDLDYIKQEGFDHVCNASAPHTRFDWYNHYHYVEETCYMMGLKKPTGLKCELGYKPKLLPGLDKTITTSMFASGNQPYKTLSPEKMEALFRAITDMGYRVMQVGSTDPYIPCGINASTSLTGAVDLICSSRLHLTIDTAFSWISSAYDRPLVGLYGRNYPDMVPGRQVSHNPINPNALYLNTEKVDNLPVELIIERLKSML